MKKFLSLVLSVVITCSSQVGFAKDIYTYKTESYIKSGIKRVHLKTMTDSGWQNINVIEADLSDKYVKAKVLVPQKGIGNLENVKSMAENYDTAASVNADFFGWNSNDYKKGSSVGAVITDGKMLTSSDNSGVMASIGITENEEILINAISTQIVVTAPKGEEKEIKNLNKFDDLSSPSIYTSDFYDVTPGSFDNILEMVIKDGTVTELRREKEGVKVPENGYVIRVLPEFDPFMEENFKEGDKIKIEFKADFDLEKVKELSGGGSLLLKDGKKTKITHNIKGKNPRTVAGSDKTGKKLYLITIDGRQDKAVGMTMEEMQDFLLSYGVYNAVNLDGGGSTTLVTKQNENQTVTNMYEGNVLRAVANGIGILSTAPKSGKLGGFKITTEDTSVFVGYTRTFNVEGAYDIYKNPYTKTLSDVVYETDSEYGYFKGNVLYATKPGKNISVFAKKGTISAEIKIDIIDSPEKITALPSHFDIKDVNNPEFVLTGTNNKAQTAKIEQRDYKISENQITKMGYKEVSSNGKIAYLTFSKATESFESLNFEAKYTDEAKADVSFKDGIKGKALKLSYDFKGFSENKKAAYAVFKNPVKINGEKQIGLWVYSPYSLNQWLRAEFLSEDGEVLRADFTENIDYSGYKYQTLKIPENAKELTKIYIVQNSLKEQNKGYLILDELSLIETDQKVSFPSKLNEPQMVENAVSSKGYTFAVTGKMPAYNNLLSKAITGRVEAFIKENNFNKVWSLSGFDFKGLDENTVKGFSYFEKDNSLFMNIDNSEHYITYTQFGKIKDALKNKKDNLFVFLYEDINLMKDKQDLEVLINLIKEYDAKNTYVFYASEESYEKKADGINYISIGGISVSTTEALQKTASPVFVVKAEINENNVSVKFVKIL